MSQAIALVQMPFGSTRRPSLALGVLAAIARGAGLTVDVHYLNFRFAQRIGLQRYEYLCGAADLDGYGLSNNDLCGEWVFSQQLHGRGALGADAYLRRLRRVHPDMPDAGLRSLLDAREQADAFLDECEASIDWRRYTLVGFTSTFEQNLAALSLAQRLKRRQPQLKIALGGANCEAGMGLELARQYRFLDLVCTGEAETSFPQLLHSLGNGEAWWRTPGFAARHRGRVYDNGLPPPTIDLDAQPDPDFDDYFAALDSAVMPDANPERGLLLETSRGCWWGQRSHCTFCGLNGHTMAFRSRKPERALEQARRMVTRHRAGFIQYVDNIIDHRYFDSFLPSLAQADLGVDVFYETKTNLRRRQVRVLAEAGVVAIQPGIESLDDTVLALMGKGVQGLRNVAVLKWARHYGLSVMWNLLYGFPGEPPAAFDEMASMMGRLWHLQPAQVAGQIRLDRFSPNFREARSRGLVRVRPAWSYRHVYDVAPAALREIAYFFDFDYADGRDPPSYCAALHEAQDAWTQSWTERARSLHALLTRGGGLEIWDTRWHDPAAARLSPHVLDPAEAAIYALFDEPRHWQHAVPLASARGLDAAALHECLDRWDAASLILRRKDTVLALATMDDATLDAVTATLDKDIARQISATRSSSNDNKLEAA
jgi:ribosomal peptide maturation radical SAM protein 1